jgi:hypothetical protein
MSIMASVDSQVARVMGPPDLSTTDLPTPVQTSLEVLPTSTNYIFILFDIVQLNVTWTTPAYSLDDDDVLSKDLPVTFLTFSATSLDDNNHSVKMYFDTTAETSVNDVSTEVSMSRTSTSTTTTLSVGTTVQETLSSNSDLINWGTQQVSVPNSPVFQTALSGDVSARTTFAATSSLPLDDDVLTRACNDNWPVLAVSFGLDASPGTAAFERVLISYDEVDTMDYFGTVLPPFWKSKFANISDVIEYASSNSESIISSSQKYDASHVSELESVGGSKYGQLLSLVHRQVTGGVAKTLSPDGSETWVWMKEISSDGDISTVDVIYPAAPFFLYTSPETLRRMFLPLLAYSANATGADENFDYNLPWAPHHLGVWPTCDILAR